MPIEPFQMLPRLDRRRSRIMHIHSRRWQQRLIFVAGGVVVGLVAVGIAVAADAAQNTFQWVIGRWPLAPLALTPAGFGLAVLLAVRYFPFTQGSGIPQVIAAKHLARSRSSAHLVGVRVAVGKIVLTLLGLLSGASTGREGPTVQVGASVMYALGSLSPRRQSGLILAGAAAGVAAAFNTPLAGVVFAIEEMSRSFEARTNGLIIAAVILAGLTAQVLLGDYSYFGFTGADLPFGAAWLAVPLCGVLGGFAGALFSLFLVSLPHRLPEPLSAWARNNPVPFAIACGFGVALCGVASGGTVYGTGYEQARELLHGTGTVPTGYAALKLAATALSAISGIPGGIFSPSLAIGAAIGADISLLFTQVTPGPIVLLGMVAYFTGVVRAPITGFVIVSEMSDNHGILVALMATALIADACARLVNRDGVYQMLSKRYLARPK